MSLDQIHVLLVEDNPGDARLLREVVKEAHDISIKLTHEDTLTGALKCLDAERFDVIMLDLSLPDAEGIETLTRTLLHSPNVPIVVLTGLDDEALAVRAVRDGAQDYLVKGQVTGPVLVRAMRYATERKRAIEDLRKSEEYFRSLIENALDIITVLDDKGVVRYGSPSLERVLGYAVSTLSETNILALIHPNDRRALLEKLVLGGQNPGLVQQFQFRLRHRDGSWRVLEAIGKRSDVNSAVGGFVVNSRDITERIRAEEALREANETIRAVIETSPLAIYSLDLLGNVKSWNRAAEGIFGYSAIEVMNRPLPIVFPEDQTDFNTRFDQGVSGNLLVGNEGRFQRKDGSAVEVSSWNAQLRDGNGLVTGIVVAVADNSERKRLEEHFRQSQKMEAVGRLAGGVAHDFNNLLTVITGYCQMLVDQLSPADSMSGDLQQVLKAADRATTLTKQLLAFSRQQIVLPKVVALDALIRDMDHILQRLAGEDIELRIEGSCGKVRVDPGQIEQVIVNLAVNARDAMPRGGKLIIETADCDFDDFSPHYPKGLPPGAYALIAVSDTGTGMDAATRSHLFEPFFTTKERGRGTGLGLSTSYGIVKQNQGSIQVYSELGIGSTFKIYLPRVDEPVDVQVEPRAERSSYRGTETVLVVEDEEGVRHVLLEMLKQTGYRTLGAECGQEAIEICRSCETPVDILITDVVMPKMGGRELAARLREVTPELKVLFVSGYTDSAIVHHGVLEPGTHFLQKPFSVEQLAGKVREVLEA
jgi:PAS domain S-box-containing protein